jgi:hypothetical protein
MASMSDRLEVQGALEILRYSGTHACSDKDHEQDHRSANTWPTACGGRGDIAGCPKLHVARCSAIDLYNAWRPGYGATRIAMLWSLLAGVDRLAFLAAQLKSVVRFFRTRRGRPLVRRRVGLRRGLRAKETSPTGFEATDPDEPTSQSVDQTRKNKDMLEESDDGNRRE